MLVESRLTDQQRYLYRLNRSKYGRAVVEDYDSLGMPAYDSEGDEDWDRLSLPFI
jgi:hypothetical protein